MGDSEQGALWLRTVVLSVVVVAAGTLAHLSGGGLPPDLLTSLLLCGFVGSGAFVVLSGPGGTAPATRAAVVVAFAASGQTVVHLALTALGGMPHHGAPMSGSMTEPMGGPLASLATELSHDHVPMLLTHLVAALVVGMWLALGDRVLAAFLAALSWAQPVFRRLRLPVRGTPRVVTAGVLTRPLDAHLRSVVVLRGPPALLG